MRTRNSVAIDLRDRLRVGAGRVVRLSEVDASATHGYPTLCEGLVVT